jgi:hypothetical protein
MITYIPISPVYDYAIIHAASLYDTPHTYYYRQKTAQKMCERYTEELWHFVFTTR